MKRTKQLIFLLIVMIFANQALAGQETGNGGDYIAQDFVISAREALDILKKKSPYFPFIDLKKVENAIKTAEIVLLAKGEVFEGYIRTAENFPHLNKIKINVDRWAQIKDPNRKMAISMHEYLGLTNYEVNNYSITGFIFGFAANEVENVPSVEDLDKSFESSKSYFDSLLKRADGLVIERWNGERGVELSEKSCNDFVSLSIKEEIPTSFDCRARENGGGIFLLTRKGLTQLGQEYEYVLISTSQIPEYGLKLMENLYYVDSRGKVIQSSKYIKWEGRYHLISKSISSIDKMGNVYTKSHSNENDSNSSYVTLGDGSAGTYLRRQFFGSDDGSNFTTTYSVANSSDWDNFSVSIFPSQSDRTYGRLNGTGVKSQTFVYEYLGQTYPSPDNYRLINYMYSNNKLTTAGLYVVNRRKYIVK